MSSRLRLPPLPTIGDLLRLFNLRALRSLSQKFLLDSKLRSKVVAQAKQIKGSHVIEVGPGPGGLTRCIIEQGAKRVDVIEKDKRFMPILNHLRESTDNILHLHLGDVLNFNMAPIFKTEDSMPWEGYVPRLHIIGNLPFNVSTPLIIKWLRAISEHSNAWVHGRVPLTLTFQDEVGDRMSVGSKHSQRSRLSIMCQNWCEVSKKFVIPGKAFIPKPDVNVAVMTFIPRIKPIIDLNFSLVERFVTATFSMRQKHSKHSIGTLFPQSIRTEMVSQLFETADVQLEKRSFELTLYEFKKLIFAYDDLMKIYPQLKKFNYRDPKANRLVEFLSNDDTSTSTVADIKLGLSIQEQIREIKEPL